MRSILLLSAFTFMSLLFLPLVIAEDTLDNDMKGGAQKIVDDDFTGNVHPDTDPSDWFYVDVPPHTSVEITVTLETLSSDHFLIVKGEKEDGGEINEIDMSLDPTGVKDEDLYLNDDDNSMDLYVHLSGKGSYRFQIFYQREIGGGCFSYLSFGLMAFIIALLAFVSFLGKR